MMRRIDGTGVTHPQLVALREYIQGVYHRNLDALIKADLDLYDLACTVEALLENEVESADSILKLPDGQLIQMVVKYGDDPGSG